MPLFLNLRTEREERRTKNESIFIRTLDTSFCIIHICDGLFEWLYQRKERKMKRLTWTESEEKVMLAGENFIYCDTDSVKYIGDRDWAEREVCVMLRGKSDREKIREIQALAREIIRLNGGRDIRFVPEQSEGLTDGKENRTSNTGRH